MLVACSLSLALLSISILPQPQTFLTSKSAFISRLSLRELLVSDSWWERLLSVREKLMQARLA